MPSLNFEHNITKMKGDINKERFDLKCDLCKVVQGACIQCDYKTCSTSFHIRCGIRTKLIVDWKVMHANLNITKPDQYLPIFCK